MSIHNDVTIAILAAGLGTRMKSRRAKVLHSAGGRTLMEHSVRTALSLAAPERVFAVVGHQAENVRQNVASYGIRFINQEEQKGTGHAILCGRNELASLGGMLLVFYGDCPLILPSTLESLIERHRSSSAAATMITTRLEEPTGYGRVVRNPAGALQSIVEQKAASPDQLKVREINAGIYCFRSELFWRYVDLLTANNPAGEYYLTDMISILIEHGHPVQAITLDDSAELLGINNRIELAAADRVLRARKVRQLLLDGVTIEKPETVTVDDQVLVGMDTVIGPFAQLRGNTVIGENCRIGACSIIEDSELADEVEIGPFTIVGTSKLERGVHAGPYARLRMGNHLAEDVHIGNFVELKKATLGAGTKAGHLAYLGDAIVGEGTNIGAGAITCNFDGVSKHQTKVGNHAFIGSNSTLVAPLEIASNSYVAAGSVITHNVPEQALALGRSRQVNKEGYAKKLARVKKSPA
ncbi:MAG: UDP-N-acetylglucosamine pyrophosphorylase / glucosamine-phosphate N-acetyltransferase [Bryobacterales bacterium]|nr:UDP-N-acetylglucosamine pyrophosphorylase / glucosamine-phosphate N-acetyltransferase [Bryobacterales bacterium]